ncbi:hypothetical protein DPEC_G00256200 [Dallia pectoralis]|uniref:Uncharacterized protein n=1 Tax=Dallia pectoralis TaxID=75939 RepID=A0ACC2FUG0_DALPE|nr:hypothetical protein DPEC_G00256200 [Dallia pectoralis]
MGVLCITLFPQERWSPSKLLNLARYQCLSQDIGDAQLPSAKMPSSIQVGEYKPTDEGLTELVMARSVTSSPVTVIKSDLKMYYGIDMFRLAPDLIQPYSCQVRKDPVKDHRRQWFFRGLRSRKLGPHRPVVPDVTKTINRDDKLLPVRPGETHGTESVVGNCVASDVSPIDVKNLHWNNDLVQMLTCSNLGW